MAVRISYICICYTLDIKIGLYNNYTPPKKDNVTNLESWLALRLYKEKEKVTLYCLVFDLLMT